MSEQIIQRKIIQIFGKTIFVLFDNDSIKHLEIDGWCISDEDYSFEPNRGILKIDTYNPGGWLWNTKWRWWKFWTWKVMTHYTAHITI